MRLWCSERLGQKRRLSRLAKTENWGDALERLLLDVFWKNVKRTKGCWIWIGAKHPKGYGFFRLGEPYRSHRFSWMLFHGRIPKDMSVLHKCDNPPCVNPKHLYLGTYKDNARDTSASRHWMYGSKNNKSKLLEKQVLEIRSKLANGAKNVDLAKKYGITSCQISRIKLRQDWKYLK